MKLRSKKYLQRKKAIREMANFKSLSSFLKAGFLLSRSLVVKKDILNTVLELRNNNLIARRNNIALAS